MTTAADATLDDILSRWHHWASRSVPVKGYAPRSLVCGEFRISRQYDDQNGALDSDVEADIMHAVDFQISEIADPWRSALHANARNLSTGRSVWSSPRLPADPAARAAILEAARLMLAKRLTTAGIIDNIHA